MLTVIDTPHFGDRVNTHDLRSPIVDFIGDQHEMGMIQEQQAYDRSDLVSMQPCLLILHQSYQPYVHFSYSSLCLN